MANKQLSKVKIESNYYDIKDAEARSGLTDIQQTLTLVDVSGASTGSVISAETSLIENPRVKLLSDQAVYAYATTIDSARIYVALDSSNGGHSISLIKSGDKYTFGSKDAIHWISYDDSNKLTISINNTNKEFILTDGAKTISVAENTAQAGNIVLTLPSVTGTLATTTDLNGKQDILTQGTGISITGNTIATDDTVVTTTKLSGGSLQAIDLDPKSSHVISQVVTAIDNYIGPTYLLYTVNKETGQIDPTNHGGMFYETEGLDNSVVAVMNQDETGKVALGSYQDRPIYYDATAQEFKDIALTTDVTGTAVSGKWTSLTINGTTASIPAGGGEGGATYSSGTGINVNNTDHTISIDEQVVAKKSDLTTKQDTLTQGTGINITGTTISADTDVVATKTEVQEKINRDEAEETIVAILTAMHLNRYYTGSSVPQASLGQDGDIYLQE